MEMVFISTYAWCRSYMDCLGNIILDIYYSNQIVSYTKI